MKRSISFDYAEAVIFKKEIDRTIERAWNVVKEDSMKFTPKERVYFFGRVFQSLFVRHFDMAFRPSEESLVKQLKELSLPKKKRKTSK